MVHPITEKDTARLKRTILENTTELVRLHRRVHEALPGRGNLQGRRKWEQACAEWHARYTGLAFPGGYEGVLERILAGDPETMEAAICFLECRPYFFRSGYMFKDILRKCRRAPLLPDQAARLAIIDEKLVEWRKRKPAKRATQETYNGMQPKPGEET
jgi:hypothetical protein